jgi:hypothetical protein
VPRRDGAVCRREHGARGEASPTTRAVRASWPAVVVAFDGVLGGLAGNALIDHPKLSRVRVFGVYFALSVLVGGLTFPADADPADRADRNPGDRRADPGRESEDSGLGPDVAGAGESTDVHLLHQVRRTACSSGRRVTASRTASPSWGACDSSSEGVVMFHVKLPRVPERPIAGLAGVVG